MTPGPVQVSLFSLRSTGPAINIWTRLSLVRASKDSIAKWEIFGGQGERNQSPSLCPKLSLKRRGGYQPVPFNKNWSSWRILETLLKQAIRRLFDQDFLDSQCTFSLKATFQQEEIPVRLLRALLTVVSKSTGQMTSMMSSSLQDGQGFDDGGHFKEAKHPNRPKRKEVALEGESLFD
ncbi:hypothetical protein BJ508DRAFT_306011 [Ascobolus immersus RN42]|uniref:Uncharacterized protein n=1 Tax=Ascobolus immersus RN42 TaxID=1160509 RepID=A0A3N4I7S1_ASCIM|nr:hypothetical protein BJ508DRAFT_306011 [Ascobolus immersus RN42]